MARIRSWAEKQQFPALSGRVQFIRRNGQVVVAAWPRKRGKKSTPAQRRWRDWFTEANRLAKIGEPGQLRLAVEYTRGTGLYPRDLILRMMSKGLVDIIDGEGPPITAKVWRLENVTWQGAILGLDIDTNLGSTGFVTLSWPTPVFQTIPFWSAGNPTRLTIPAGVEIVQITGGIGSVVNALQRSGLLINQNGALAQIHQATDPVTNTGLSITTGPLLVTPGDFFELRAFISASPTAKAYPFTWFAATILQATV